MLDLLRQQLLKTMEWDLSLGEWTARIDGYEWRWSHRLVVRTPKGHLALSVSDPFPLSALKLASHQEIVGYLQKMLAKEGQQRLALLERAIVADALAKGYAKNMIYYVQEANRIDYSFATLDVPHLATYLGTTRPLYQDETITVNTDWCWTIPMPSTRHEAMEMVQDDPISMLLHATKAFGR